MTVFAKCWSLILLTAAFFFNGIVAASVNDPRALGCIPVGAVLLIVAWVVAETETVAKR